MPSPFSALRITSAANIPVLPVVKGISVAKNHITLYIIAFAVATLMLSLGGYAGYKYLVVAAAVSVWWLGMALRGYKVADDRIWARKLFGFSIIAITALSVMMSVDFYGTGLAYAAGCCVVTKTSLLKRCYGTFFS